MKQLNIRPAACLRKCNFHRWLPCAPNDNERNTRQIWRRLFRYNIIYIIYLERRYFSLSFLLLYSCSPLQDNLIISILCFYRPEVMAYCKYYFYVIYKCNRSCSEPNEYLNIYAFRKCIKISKEWPFICYLKQNNHFSWFVCSKLMEWWMISMHSSHCPIYLMTF